MLNWLERKIGWIAFPQIIRYLAFFQLGLIVLSLFNPGTGELLSFNWSAILKGEVWRIFSFIFVPLTGEGQTGIIFAVFGALLLMMFNDGLENQWGYFRTTLFFIGGWLSCIIASILFSLLSPLIPLIISPTILFDYAIFFAFATYYPKHEIRIFFILPVKIFLIAIFGGVMVLLMTRFNPILLAYTLACLTHYLVIAIPKVFNRGKAKAHKVNYQRKQRKPAVFHTCSVCGITDADDDTLEFRVRADGTEICENCLKD